MDLAQLESLTRQAGYRIDWTALLPAAAHYPEQVLDWISAAGELAAANAGCHLLTTVVADLRDRIVATNADHLYQYADQLSEVCDLLTDSQRARDEAHDRLADSCAALAARDPAAMRADPDSPPDPPRPRPAQPSATAVPASHRCRLRPSPSRHRSRRPPRTRS